MCDGLIPYYYKEYMNHTREQHGVWSLEFGRQYYQECLRFYLNFDISAEEVRDTGHRELARIKALMEQVGLV